ncbi:aliphatic sulfonates import ATP-binding protein SsuB 1 [Weizmannia acidilactici]|uniref:Aliphatic sulfonates import ATP-binding protein SsuB 1 n=1 Tax=Weizmannia acidilactici TaxID=2607726 RepID=A0A5J4J9Q8_9BACI|nr:ATP-binding cassette domain-containing protein [Weizmannia acidilactici]GER67736.1 aliphatic sulfonates import ATP-binding protein SsuB 1 [Weizmannia acidilactici]GER71542.1 aliphatic sulfonates import ATP-binding protein SsuB 1 [Weizmannia acidilactici]GER73614.1 aliphatic sulfonates import ATP-binding protein SsuB 1 [Weizmannia acidilactici]
MASKEKEIVLEVDDLQKSFGSHQVLRKIDLKVKKGEFVAIVGRSGCGKSTLLRLLAGLEKASSGTIFINGKPLSGKNPSVKIMFQDGRLLPWKKILQNVGLGLQGDWKECANQMLKQVGLDGRANDWPSELSGGQKQRVALARALVHEPEILLLDEPLGALDALTRIEMHQLIQSLWLEKNFTAILVTHDVEEAVALADRVILIENGEIAMNYPVKLPHPRKRDHALFSSTVNHILNRILGDGGHHGLRAAKN